MKLIFVHGRDQHNKEAKRLKTDWIDNWQKGLAKSGLALPSNLEIEFPYYGDLLKKLTNEYKTAAKPDGTVKRGGSDIVINEAKEIAFFEEYWGELAEGLVLTDAEKEHLKNLKTIKRDFYNHGLYFELLRLLEKNQTISELALRVFTLDVFMYLTVPKVKNQVNEVVLQSFGFGPCVVVGHSLGSVVSYLILRDNPQLAVKKFITVGSPLGSVTIRNRLGGTRMPACVQNGWFNAFDELDLVSLNPLNKKHFNVSPPIENKNNVKNHTSNKHGIEGYLDDDVVARKIYDAIIL